MAILKKKKASDSPTDAKVRLNVQVQSAGRKNFLHALKRLERAQKELNRVQGELVKAQQELLKLQKERDGDVQQLLTGQDALTKNLRRQMNSFQDLADELEERFQTEQAEKTGQDREKTLVQAIQICAGQMHLMEQSIRDLEAGQRFRPEEAEAWNRQLTLLRSERKTALELAGVQEIGAVGDSFDYRLHEILAPVEILTDTQREQLGSEPREGQIVQVYQPGLIYMGEVIKKAQVAVYRCPADSQTDYKGEDTWQI